MRRGARGERLFSKLSKIGKGLGLLLFVGLACGRSRGLCGRSRRMSFSGHALLEAADAFAEALCEFGNFAAAEQQQNHCQHDQPMNWTKFTHKQPPRGLPVRALSTSL